MRLGEDQRERALAWLEEGVSSSVVAGKIGCSIRTVQRLAHHRDKASRRAPGLDRDDELGEMGRKSTDFRAGGPRKAYGAIVGVISLTISVALTGSAQLAATDVERRDIGGSLSDALQHFPETSPVVKVFNAIRPWSVVIDHLATSVHRRAVYVTEHRVLKRVT